MAARRGKWHQPPAPTPRIIHLLRRSRLSRSTKVALARPTRLQPGSSRNLGALFDEERWFASGGSERRAGVAATSSGYSAGDSGEERWRFQAEILRAECNFLRMEREVALRKLDRNRTQMEAALRSAVETLISGSKKIDGSESMGTALKEEIKVLEEKLEELQLEKSGRRRGNEKSCGRNFDRQASVLRRRLEKTADETSVREVGEITAEDSDDKEDSPLQSDHPCRFPDVDILGRRMEGLSQGMLERMEEYGFLLSGNSPFCSHSTTISGSESKLRCGSSKAHDHCQPQQVEGEKGWAVMGSENCCNCKKVVGWIIKQVRAETEQWSEMQGMLEQVRVDMEELHSSKDLWQHRAITSKINICSIQAQMLEWEQRARISEHKVTELQKLVPELQIKLKSTRTELFKRPTSSSRTRSEKWNQDLQTIKNQEQRMPDSHSEKQKHVLVCRLKNPHSNFPRRLPLQDIGNSPPTFRP